MAKKKNTKEAIVVKSCSIKSLPQEHWIKAAEKARAINPANAPAVHQLNRMVPGAVIPPASYRSAYNEILEFGRRTPDGRFSGWSFFCACQTYPLAYECLG